MFLKMNKWLFEDNQTSSWIS